MTSNSEKHGCAWSEDDAWKLRELAAERLPVILISKALGRTERAIRTRAEKMGIELKKPKGKFQKGGNSFSVE